MVTTGGELWRGAGGREAILFGVGAEVIEEEGSLPEVLKLVGDRSLLRAPSGGGAGCCCTKPGSEKKKKGKNIIIHFQCYERQSRERCWMKIKGFAL